MITSIAAGLAAQGHGVITFNYPYTEAGRRGPDRAPKLLDCHRAVVDFTTSLASAPPVLAGRSMGGRMATMLAAEGTSLTGVVCLAYPLHPAGKPDRLRIEHLSNIAIPVLFFQGSRDALSLPELFDVHVRRLAMATVVDMEGANHSFKGRGWTQDRVVGLVTAEYAAWLSSLES